MPQYRRRYSESITLVVYGILATIDGVFRELVAPGARQSFDARGGAFSRCDRRKLDRNYVPQTILQARARGGNRLSDPISRNPSYRNHVAQNPNPLLNGFLLSINNASLPAQSLLREDRWREKGERRRNDGLAWPAWIPRIRRGDKRNLITAFSFLTTAVAATTLHVSFRVVMGIGVFYSLPMRCG